MLALKEMIHLDQVRRRSNKGTHYWDGTVSFSQLKAKKFRLNESYACLYISAQNVLNERAKNQMCHVESSDLSLFKLLSCFTIKAWDQSFKKICTAHRPKPFQAKFKRDTDYNKYSLMALRESFQMLLPDKQDDQIGIGLLTKLGLDTSRH